MIQHRCVSVERELAGGRDQSGPYPSQQVHASYILLYDKTSSYRLVSHLYGCPSWSPARKGFAMFYHLGKFATRYRWLIVGFWMVAIAIGLPFAPQASSVLHSGGFTSPDVESQQAVDLLSEKLHLNLTVVQVIFTSQRYNAYSPQFIQESQKALANVRSWSEVSGVINYTDNPRQVSIDQHAAYANVLLKPEPDSAPKLLPELEHRLQSAPDLHTSIGGGPVFYEDIQSVSERDLRRAEILAFPFAIIALLLVFRSLIAAILPALIGGGAVVVSLALIFGLGQLTTLSIFVLNITTLFGLGL